MMWTDERIAAIADSISRIADPETIEQRIIDAMTEMRNYFLDTKTLAAECNRHMSRVKVLEAQIREQSERRYY